MRIVKAKFKFDKSQSLTIYTITEIWPLSFDRLARFSYGKGGGEVWRQSYDN